MELPILRLGGENMQVFKLYFKLLKSVAPALIIYGIIFGVLVFLFSTNQNQGITHYEETKIDSAIVNYNEDSILVQDFLEYLSEFCTFHDYGDDESDLTDALFFQEVDYIITVPYSFGEDFLLGKDVAVEKKTVPDGMHSAAVDNAINNYLNTARIYLKAIPDISEKDLVSYIRKDMNAKAYVAIDTKEKIGRDNAFYNSYFNTSAYIMLAGCILGIGIIMLSFHNVYIHRRNMVTPMSINNMNLQLICGNLVFVLFFDLIFIIFGMILNIDKSINGNVILFWLNTVIFSMCALSISYLVAILVKSKAANDAISYVLPLGLSFISGAFVPQFLLGESVLNLASFTPVYWYIKGNDTIASLSHFNWENVKDIFNYMGIQIGFAAALLALSLVISKNKSQRNY